MSQKAVVLALESIFQNLIEGLYIGLYENKMLKAAKWIVMPVKWNIAVLIIKTSLIIFISVALKIPRFNKLFKTLCSYVGQASNH